MEYYTILGVAHTATFEEIKKSYRALAFKFHPDKNPGNKEAEARFKEIASAYEILSCPQKRAEFDSKGYVGRHRPSTPPTRPPKPEPPKPPESPKSEWNWDFNTITSPTQSQLDSVVCNFFGNPSTGRHIITHVECSHRELNSGCRKFVVFKKGSTCARCMGDGDIRVPCDSCTSFAPGEMKWCKICEGSTIIHKKCGVCQGKGTSRWVIMRLMITVPSGSKPGTMLTCYGEGEDAPGRPPGNLRVVLVEKENDHG